jgi:hypothetical protein
MPRSTVATSWLKVEHRPLGFAAVLGEAVQ